jgi:NitT/TauT family transport system substrate-binding protein
MINRRNFTYMAGAIIIAGVTSCHKRGRFTPDGKPIIAVGHFPNITHVQALVAHQLSRQGRGWFEERLGVSIEWFIYNAGSSAAESIVSGALDLAYMGPGPVINTYARSGGEEMRIISGAANGGSALVVRADAGVNTAVDFKGKKIASPQLGGTQDIQLRSWLIEQGFTVKNNGGDVIVIPTQNADQLGLFESKNLDAAWTVEPWVTRLELEAGAKIFLEDRETNVTLLVSRAAFLNENPDLTKKFLVAHRELTNWIQGNLAEAKELIKKELKELMGAEPKDQLITSALSRIVITNEISRKSLDEMVVKGKKVGFLNDVPDLARLLQTL